MHSPPSGGRLAPKDESLDTSLVTGRLTGDRILVPLLTRTVPALSDQLKIATTLARVTGAPLTVINPTSVPEQTPNAYHHQATERDDTALLEWVFDQTADPLPHVDGELLYTRNVVRGVLQAVRRYNVDTLVVPGRSQSSRLRKHVIEQVAAHADADVVVVNGQPGFREPASVLLPVAGGPHSGIAADVASSIAADCDAWVDVLHVVDEDAPEHRRERAEALVEEISHRVDRPETTTTWLLEAPDTVEAIIEQSRYYDLTILGAPTKGRLRRLIFGSTTAAVRANAESVVLSARNNSGPPELSD